MANSLELLEEKFRRVEEASERQSSQRELVDPSNLTRQRSCRKPRGVSVSQFGKQEERSDGGSHSLVSSPLSAAGSKSTFYHNLANPISVDSLVSENSGETHHDEEHEIQVERIAGRQILPKTVGALLTRRLTRAQSHIDYVSVDRNTVIDVSVETTTESSHLDLQSSRAYATDPSRPRSATVGILPFHGSLVERAKDFAHKLRRKGRADLP